MDGSHRNATLREETSGIFDKSDNNRLDKFPSSARKSSSRQGIELASDKPLDGQRSSSATSFILVNIARLITQSGNRKSGFLSDLANLNNSPFVAVTETWLKDSIFDSEVLYNFTGYNIFRSDRSNERQGGGVCLYLKDCYTGDILSAFSNSVCELLVVKVHQLNSVVCIAYRPPDTKRSEFKELLECLEETLKSLPTPAPNILLMGDLNFSRRSLFWSQDEHPFLIPQVRNYRDCSNSEGKQDRPLMVPKY